MKDLTLTGFAMNKIEEINKQIEDCREELNRLNGIKRQLRMNAIDTTKWQSNKIYKFRIPEYDDKWSDEKFVGTITDIWYSELNNKYIVELCAVYDNFFHDCIEYADCQWGGFDANIQYELDEEQVKRLIDNLEEISLKEFNEYMENVFWSRLHERSLYWIEKNINKK